ncbi:enoyl-CoA hydratase [uncultured Aliivibrio sp.]|uniref:enoyl-CoA hydratase n=1 Tax=uncultured Aliivibrio sp. TaxID=873085 RepID=UPI0026063A5A|nr:enoyl-CoA hydratase [uncultured Aliivibrio sp.]
MKVSKENMTNLMFLVGIIMYVGGILSHIVIGNVFNHDDMHALYYMSVYKEQSAYILIVPGLILKLLATFMEFKQYKVKPVWLKIQYACMMFLTINALVFLVPMMPELTALSAQNIALGQITSIYQETAHREMLIGISNALPLLIMVVLSGLSPKGNDDKNRY